MIKELCNFMFFGHSKCKDDIHKMIQSKLDDDRHITRLLGQIQELKAINDYQTYELENRIKELEKFNADKIFECLEIQSSYQSLRLECDEEYDKNIRLRERLDSFEREISTLSGVLRSEPIMEALGNKNNRDKDGYE
ncbi:MAG TPA: hypothetical protein VII94_01320 [Candidatus Saccharimonadales bacterium]